MDHAIDLASPNHVSISTLGTSIARRRSRHSQMKNSFFSPASQRLIASNPNRLGQFLLGGHLGSHCETALDTAHQTELTAVRKPLPTNQLNNAHFISRRTRIEAGCDFHFTIRPLIKRKARGSNPQGPEAARFRKPARQAISGYLPYLRICILTACNQSQFAFIMIALFRMWSGLNHGERTTHFFPAKNLISQQPAQMLVTVLTSVSLRPMGTRRFSLSEETTLSFKLMALRSNVAITVRLQSMLGSSDFSGPHGSRTHHTDLARISRHHRHASPVAQVRPGVEPDPRPYQQRTIKVSGTVSRCNWRIRFLTPLFTAARRSMLGRCRTIM